MALEPSGFLPRSFFQWMLNGARSTPASTNGRMFRRTPSLRSGSQPDRLLGERLPAHEDVVGGLALEDQPELALQPRAASEALGPGDLVAQPARWRSIQSCRGRCR